MKQSGEVRGGKDGGIRGIEELKIRGGNVMHESQNEERQQQQHQEQHMCSPPSQRSSVENPADQRVFTKVATCYFIMIANPILQLFGVAVETIIR